MIAPRPRRVQEGAELDADIQSTFVVQGSSIPAGAEQVSAEGEEPARWTINGTEWAGIKIDLNMRFTTESLPEPPEDP